MKLNSKQKGNRGERELAKIFNKRFGEGLFKRTPMSGGFVGGGNQASAINLSEEAKITLVSDLITPINFKFIVEHKFYNGANFWDLLSYHSTWIHWIDQIEYDAKFVNKYPLIVVKYNRHKRIALVPEVLLMNEEFTTPKLFWNQYRVILFDDLLKMDDDWWFFEKIKI